jgi:glutamine synthetase
MNEERKPDLGSRRPAGRLERWIGKAPSAWTAEDLVDVIRERKVRILSLLHVGSGGILKTLDFVPRSVAHARDILEGGERADGSNVLPRAGLTAGMSDIVLRPRIDRAFIDPFSPHRTLAVMCNHLDRNGEPLPESPDTVVRRAWRRLRDERGIDLRALGEIEYFLGKRPEEGDVPGKAERGYHGTSPYVFGQDLRRRAIALLADIGSPVKYAHSEVGYIEAEGSGGVTWEQHEIELGLVRIPDAADAISLTRWVLMNLARRERMRISFEPIVRVGHAGSGMHLHLSPYEDGEPIPGRGPDGELGRAAKWIIAGLVRLGGALMAFGNRLETSFVRIRQGREAPTSVTWGEYDRSALIRIPLVVRAGDGREVTPETVEFRLPDGSAHPHLLLAGVAQAVTHAAGLADLEEILDATISARARVQPETAYPLPRTFAEVERELRRHEEVFRAGDVFPPGVLERAVLVR